MTRIILSFVLGLIFFAITIQAQSGIALKTNKINLHEKQFNASEQNLIKVLESGRIQGNENKSKTLQELQQLSQFSSFKSEVRKTLINFVIEGGRTIHGFWNSFKEVKRSEGLQ